VGCSLRNGNSAQAAELLNLKNHLSEQQSHTGADVNTLQQEVARLQTQLRTEHFRAVTCLVIMFLSL
jgi:ribosomal protein L29